jgi:hypothetical protein
MDAVAEPADNHAYSAAEAAPATGATAEPASSRWFVSATRSFPLWLQRAIHVDHGAAKTVCLHCFDV